MIDDKFDERWAAGYLSFVICHLSFRSDACASLRILGPGLVRLIVNQSPLKLRNIVGVPV